MTLIKLREGLKEILFEEDRIGIGFGGGKSSGKGTINKTGIGIGSGSGNGFWMGLVIRNDSGGCVFSI